MFVESPGPNLIVFSAFLQFFEKVGPNWSESEIRSFGNAELSVSSLDEWADHLFISSESFTEPTYLYYANADKDFKKIKSKTCYETIVKKSFRCSRKT